MITMLQGDCRDLLRTLPDASVHCVVTSPPYWGLRDYGVDGQLGLEPDFNAYVASMVAVFREVRRVLRDDGTLWLNLGDSYYSAGGQTTGYNDPNWIKTGGACNGGPRTKVGSIAGLKPKDLCGIPWRVAFALQADGWYLRQDIIWSKPNPMPESVTDRCTKAHEYLFLMSKRPTYYYDAEAIAEASVIGAGALRNITPGNKGAASTRKDGDRFGVVNDGTRNKRSVWEVTTQPFSEAHFATFPPALIEPCIKAGTSERGCCAKCGKPWVRQIEYGDLVPTRKQYDRRPYGVVVDAPDAMDQGRNRARDGHRANMAYEKKSLGWSPSCACNAEIAPCTVLDPFAGAGTTGLVADRLQRNAILIELNPAYAAMGERRITGDAPLFVEIAPQQTVSVQSESWAEMWAKPFDWSQEPKT